MQEDSTQQRVENGYRLTSPFWHPLRNIAQVQPLIVGACAALITYKVQQRRPPSMFCRFITSGNCSLLEESGRIKHGPVIAFIVGTIASFTLAKYTTKKELEFQMKTEYLAKRKAEVCLREMLDSHSHRVVQRLAAITS
jgi:hypothetical protein